MNKAVDGRAGCSPNAGRARVTGRLIDPRLRGDDHVGGEDDDEGGAGRTGRRGVMMSVGDNDRALSSRVERKAANRWAAGPCVAIARLYVQAA